MATVEFNLPAKANSQKMTLYPSGQRFLYGGQQLVLLRVSKNHCALLSCSDGFPNGNVWSWATVPYTHHEGHGFGVSKQDFDAVFPKGLGGMDYKPVKAF